MKKIFVLFLIMMLVCTGIAAAEDTQLRGYIKGQGYQYIHFGQYPYDRKGNVEPVLWRILEVKDGKALLLTEQIIDCRQVIDVTDEKAIKNYTYRRITHYTESDLYTWLNTEALDTLLGDSVMRNALVPDEWGGKFFILSDEQFLNVDYGFTNDRWNEQKPRQATVTPYGKKRGVYESNENGKASYWVNAIKEVEGYKLQLVGYDGHMSWGAYSRKNVGVRPSVQLDLAQLEVVSGTGTKKDPFVFEYTGMTDAAHVSGEELE